MNLLLLWICLLDKFDHLIWVVGLLLLTFIWCELLHYFYRHSLDVICCTTFIDIHLMSCCSAFIDIHWIRVAAPLLLTFIGYELLHYFYWHSFDEFLHYFYRHSLDTSCCTTFIDIHWIRVVSLLILTFIWVRKNLKRQLDARCHQVRFSNMLFIEESQMEVDIRKYDLRNVTLEKCPENKRLLSLEVIAAFISKCA